MDRAEFYKWFNENIVRTKDDNENKIFEFAIDGRTFTTKKGKSGYLSVYETTSGRKCVATRILDEPCAVE